MTSDNIEAKFDKAIHEIGMLIDQKKFDLALTNLKKMPAKYKQRSLYQAYLGYSHFYLEDFEAAISCFDNVLEIKKTAENVLYMRALAKDRLNKIDEAKEDYDQVLALNPKAKLVHRNLGLLSESEERFKEARLFYIQALKVDSSDQVSKDRLAELR